MIESSWQPELRPHWVTLMNQVGMNLGPPEVLVPLDEGSLLEAATSLTGLDDFGSDEWREPFRILLDDIERHAQLTLVGRLLSQYDLVRSLVARLGMAEAEKQHPEILEQPVESPVFITGMGRTGTSILYELLAQDPRWRTPLGWELRYPSPPPDVATRLDDERIAKAAAEIELWLEVVPEFLAIHEMASEGPDEDVVGQMHEFTSSVWSSLHNVPNYDAYLATPRGIAEAYRFHRRLLQHLQWRSPGQWLLKGPSHLGSLPGLFAEYPDARVIMTHRDPIKVLASTANLIITLRWQRSDHVNYDEFAEMIGFGFPILFEIVMEQRNKNAVPDDRFTDVRFADLMQDHVATVRTIYDKLGMELSDHVAERIRAYIAAKPAGRHGGRGYRFEDMGLDEADTRARLARYIDHFNIPEEKL